MSSLLFTLILSAHAGLGKGHILMCNVLSFDPKEVVAQCHPKKPKERMRIPRRWLASDEKVQVHRPIRMVLDEAKWKQWLAMNGKRIRK